MMRIFNAFAEPHGFILMTMSWDAGEHNVYTTEQAYLDGTGPDVEIEPGTEGRCGYCHGSGRITSTEQGFGSGDEVDEIVTKEVRKQCKHCQGSGRKLVTCRTCQGTGFTRNPLQPCSICTGTGYHVNALRTLRKEEHQ